MNSMLSIRTSSGSHRRLGARQTRRPRLGVLLLSAAVALAAATANAEDAFVSAGTSAAGATTLSIVAPSGKPIALTFLSSAAKPPKSARVSLTQFVGEASRVTVPVSFASGVGEATPGESLSRSVALTDGELRLAFAADDLPPGDVYGGYLMLLPEGVDPPQSPQRIRLVLDPDGGPPAELAVSPATFERAVTLSLSDWLGISQPSATFLIQTRNAKPTSVARGIYLRLLKAKGPGGSFPPAEHVALRWNDKAADGLWRSDGEPPPPSDLVLRAGNTADVGGNLFDLSAGEYTLDAQVTSPTSKAVDTNQFHLAVQVRDPWLVAAFDILVAIGFSFFANKGLSIRRERLLIRRRISDTRVGWLDELPAILPVIWVRAMLKLTDTLASTFSLAGSDNLSKRLDQMQGLLAVLEHVRRVRRGILAQAGDAMVIRRALKKLSSILSPLDAGPIDDQTKQNTLAQLNDLESWLTEGQLLPRYWADLQLDISQLLRTVRPDDLPEPSGVDPGDTPRKIARDLVAALKADIATQPPDLPTAVQIEHRFATLEVLWKRRSSSDTDLAELVKTYKASPLSAEPLFRVADDQAWRLLKKTGVKFVQRYKSENDRSRSFEPIRFELECDDPIVAASWLFNNGLRYEWTITVSPPGVREEPGEESVVLRPVTEAPRVTQYSPIDGTLYASVRIVYPNPKPRGAESSSSPDELEPIVQSDAARPVAPTVEFAFRRSFDAIELGALSFATMLALISGLSLKYVGNPTFGTLSDYLLLFLWGAGADQSKNFLMLLNEYSAKSSSAP